MIEIRPISSLKISSHSYSLQFSPQTYGIKLSLFTVSILLPRRMLMRASAMKEDKGDREKEAAESRQLVKITGKEIIRKSEPGAPFKF